MRTKEKKEIFLIDPAVKEIEQGLFKDLLKTSNYPISVHFPALKGMQTILSREKQVNIAALIILGSYTSVYDNLDWQDEFKAWLTQKLNLATACLGVCYAHQLIADIFGGKIAYIKQDKQIYKGIRKFICNDNFSLASKDTRGFIVCANREYVATCPPLMQPFLLVDGFKYEGLLHAKLPIWTFQGHIEANKEFCKKNKINNEDYLSIGNFGHEVIKNFFNFVSQY